MAAGLTPFHANVSIYGWDFHFPLPPVATSPKGTAVGLRWELPAVRACTFHFKPLLHTPPGMLKRFIGDHRSQKRVLCLSGGMSTDVIAVVNIFLAQGSDMLREKNLQPFDLVVPAHSWVLCLVLPGTLEKGWPLSRRCWRPWVCAHPRPRAVAPEPPCWPPAREDPVRDHAACGIQVPSMRCRCAGL